jgi:hypothetical protein
MPLSWGGVTQGVCAYGRRDPGPPGSAVVQLRGDGRASTAAALGRPAGAVLDATAPLCERGAAAGAACGRCGHAAPRARPARALAPRRPQLVPRQPGAVSVQRTLVAPLTCTPARTRCRARGGCWRATTVCGSACAGSILAIGAKTVDGVCPACPRRYTRIPRACVYVCMCVPGARVCMCVRLSHMALTIVVVGGCGWVREPATRRGH